MVNQDQIEISVGDRVSYQDSRSVRKGTVIEVNYDWPGVRSGASSKRARVKWDDNRPRTWIRVIALTKI